MKSLKKVAMPVIGILSVLYLINPTMGVFELIPDNIPFVGNLDEAAAVTLLLSVLKYYGVDLTNLFSGKKDDQEISTRN
jgi:uncharacterized membrane protein YkvA (DUF1232 family)